MPQISAVQPGAFIRFMGRNLAAAKDPQTLSLNPRDT